MQKASQFWEKLFKYVSLVAFRLLKFLFTLAFA